MENAKQYSIKLEHIEGCVCDSINIDGVETIDMPIEKLLGIIQIILKKCDDVAILQDVLMLLIDEMGEYECSEEPCEECGDYITTNTLRV